MYRLFPFLPILLTLIASNNGQQQCAYRILVQPGYTYGISSVGYPQPYYPGWFCQWSAESNSPMRFTCESFNVPFTTRCAGDRLLIRDGNAPGRLYCGGSRFSTLSNTNRLSITAVTGAFSRGGSFNCTLTAVAPEPTSSCECGRKNPARIHGGQETGVHEYPMMAAVIDSEKSLLVCGATIINVKQVLTAAHCVYRRDPKGIGVLVGDHDIARGDDTLAPAILRPAENITVHHRYSTSAADFDIALVTVKGTIPFSEVVGPVCLPFQRRDATFYRDTVDVMGWGATSHAGGPINVLMKASLTVTTRDQCLPYFPVLTDRQMCTQEQNRDSCSFDSGGPLVIESGSSRRVVQVGIISRGSACGYGEAALNTRVGPFIPWIEANTPPGILYCKVE